MFENDVEKDIKKERMAVAKKTKYALMSILSSPKALILMVLSIATFGVTTYVLIKLTTMDLIFDPGNGLEPMVFNFDALFYISIVLSALLPAFYVAVYISSRNLDWYHAAKWFHFARIYMIVTIVLVGIAAGYALISVLLALTVYFLYGFIVLLLLALIFFLTFWILSIILSFITSIRDNLEMITPITHSNPSKLIVVTWITFTLSVISFILGLLGGSSDLMGLPVEVTQLINTLSTVNGLLSLGMSAIMLAILYDIRDNYTLRKFKAPEQTEERV